MKRSMTDIIKSFFLNHKQGEIVIRVEWEYGIENKYTTFSLDGYIETLENLDDADGFLDEKMMYSVHFLDRGVPCIPEGFEGVTCTAYEHLCML